MITSCTVECICRFSVISFILYHCIRPTSFACIHLSSMYPFHSKHTRTHVYQSFTAFQNDIHNILKLKQILVMSTVKIVRIYKL